MSERDELALILVNAQRARYSIPPRTTTEHCSESCWAEVDAILAAGYRKHEHVTTEWEFLNAHDCWVKANPNNPEESARNNAAYFKTNRVRSREVTRTEWSES